MQPDVLPEARELSDSVELEISPGGGHVGFVTGPVPWKPIYWLDDKIPDYLTVRLRPD